MDGWIICDYNRAISFNMTGQNSFEKMVGWKRNTYCKHAAYDPAVVLSKGPSIGSVCSQENRSHVRKRHIIGSLCWKCGATYWAPPGCPAVPRWPPTGTPWETWGLVGATAEPRWPSCAPERPPSPPRAARWTVAWGRCRGWISASGGFSTAKGKNELQGVLYVDVTWFLDKDGKTLQPQNVQEQNIQNRN